MLEGVALFLAATADKEAIWNEAYVYSLALAAAHLASCAPLHALCQLPQQLLTDGRLWIGGKFLGQLEGLKVHTCAPDRHLLHGPSKLGGASVVTV